jgi:hypothetical protein
MPVVPSDHGWIVDKGVEEIAIGVLCQALIATRGYVAPEVEQTYARTRELCQQVEDTPQLFPVLRGLHRFYLVRGQCQTAHAFGEQCFRLAQQTQDSDLKRWNSVLP